MKLRSGLLVATVIAVLVPLGALGTASSAAAATGALGDPSVSEPPSGSFVAACTDRDGSQSSIDVCTEDAIPDFNRARAAEGLTPLVLPNDFDQLSVAEQLLALTNIERVDRGLSAVAALSSRLNTLAQSGADAGTDPGFPQPFDGTSSGSSWFGGTSSLLAMYEWMYDDGPGSGNVECPTGTEQACWGHRHGILGTAQSAGSQGDYDTPIAMGAAIGAGGVTEELIGGDTTDKADGTPTWAQIVSTSVFGLDQGNAQLEAQPGGQASLTVTATSSSLSGPLNATISHGAPQWSVTPASCTMTPGASCNFTVRFSPTATGQFPGVLAVVGGLTERTVALAGIGEAPRVFMNLGRVSLRQGQTLLVFGVVRNADGSGVLSGIPVTLQSRATGGSAWSSLGVENSGGSGEVSFATQPGQTAAYRLVVFGSNGAPESATAARRVRVY